MLTTYMSVMCKLNNKDCLRKTEIMKIQLLVCLLSVQIVGFSQSNYKNLMYDNSVNFYSVCSEANAYFALNDKNVKGSGWKQFQRWKNDNEYKYFPSGDRHSIDPYFAANSYKGYLKQNQTLDRASTSGWIELGPTRVDTTTRHGGPGLGIVNDFYIDPLNSDLIYLGTKSGGFWKSFNGGISWLNTTDFLFASGVNAITASPTNSDSVLINVRNSHNGTTHGIYRSVDAGATWSITDFNPTNLGLGGLGGNFQITKLEYHPLVPGLIFILRSEGLYRSDDDLETWTLVSSLISTSQPTYTQDFAFHPTDPNIIYSHVNNPGQVMISVDMGQSFFIQSNSGFSQFLEVSQDCPDCLYKASNSGVWKSTDKGENFVLLNNAAGTSWTTWKASFAVSDIDTSKMIIGGIEVQNSIDGGQTFNETTAYYLANPIHGNDTYNTSNWTNLLHNSLHFVHADIRMAKCVNGIFYIGTDGYLCKSDDNGATWEKLNQGTGIRENYALGVSQSNHDRTICGSQDNGVSIKHENIWLEFASSDGIDGVIHPLNDNWMIGRTYNGTMRPTQDGGLTFFQEFGMSTGYGDFEAPIAYDPNDHMRVFNFTDKVHVNQSFFLSPWDYVGEPSSFTTYITDAAIAENNSNIMLISGGSILEKSIDGGTTFSVIGNGLPTNSKIQDIAFDPNNDEVIIVVYASYQNDNNKVFITTNGGNSWSNITHNLNNMPIHTVVIDHTTNSNIYLGAEIGVYTKGMQDNSWSLYNPSLPNVTIEELEIVYGSNTLRAATWGRGLWEFKLVGREDFPSILRTSINDIPTDTSPQENINQYVTSIISYQNTISSVYVEYYINDNSNPAISIAMLNAQDSTWVSEVPLPNYIAGTKVYFKVYATGDNNDTTESYKFMYTVKPGDGQVYGCIDSLACNFNSLAQFDDESCEYPQEYYNCDGDCNNDGDGDGVCDEFEIEGCLDEIACNYNINATESNLNLCEYAEIYYDCDGNCIEDEDGDGVCNELEIPGCTNNDACNYSSNATDENQSCFFVGDACDDGDPNTIDDQIQDDCECTGTANSDVNELEALSVVIYPNPASNNLTVDLGDLKGINTTIKLYDSSSKLVFKKQSSATLLIDVSAYAKGLYTLELYTSDKVLSSQVIIE